MKHRKNTKPRLRKSIRKPGMFLGSMQTFAEAVSFLSKPLFFIEAVGIFPLGALLTAMTETPFSYAYVSAARISTLPTPRLRLVPATASE